MTRVLLAHAHPRVRAWMREVLAQAQDVELAAEASEGAKAWHLVQQLRCDVALIACSLPGTPDTVAIAGRVQVAGTRARLLILGTPEHDGLLCHPWRARAAGCVPEGAPPEDIVEAVRVAARGRSLWTPAQITRAGR